ncbi:DUF4397 domain-containing protein [Cytobacillus spongiae]|uniref:DUF4397 domain-containing protein n=1 Tax=Cytobacillus spongiae TaxID=2901381 RepID=UPI001F237A7A|nr:DUF4397 domain-containing protein [Cytobacillus spongiae]UII54501.1 DUF4397 domain-containing protein [Cytobacillus spongiae]
MAKNRNQHHYLEEAALYDVLAGYYKYINPTMHIHYYQKHLKCLHKALNLMRMEANNGNSPAMVRVLHASPDAPNVDVYVNGNPILKNVEYKQSSKYMSLPAGRYQIDIYPTGTMVSTVISKKVHVEPGKFYTLAAIGPVSKLRLAAFEDMPQVPAGETKARFIHLSPDAPAVDIAVKNRDVIFPNVSFKEATDYLGLSPMTVDLEARVAGTKNVVLSLPGIQLNPNEAYTIVAVGFVSDDPQLEAIILKG